MQPGWMPQPALGRQVPGATNPGPPCLRLSAHHLSLPVLHAQHLMAPPALLQMSKAPIQAFADRVSAVFVPVVVALALLTWAVW